jgi:hypothetical protein
VDEVVDQGQSEYDACAEHIRLEHDGEVVTEEAQMRVAATELVNAVPQRLAGLKLWRVGDNAGAQG